MNVDESRENEQTGGSMCARCGEWIIGDYAACPRCEGPFPSRCV